MVRRLSLLLLAATVCAPSFARAPLPIEPIDIPPSVEQGIDLIYIDPEIAPSLEERNAILGQTGIKDQIGGAVDLLFPVHPIYTELRRSLVRYRMSWGALPQIEVPSGPTLKKGVTGERVALLRHRLGMKAGSLFDDALAKAVHRYQEAHGMKPDGIAGAATIASLNLGAIHYERLVMLNLERGKRLPSASDEGRYILVDVGAAELYVFEGGQMRDRMKVVVGKAASATPMMAAMIRYASVNPYWNVPPDLARKIIAPRVLSDGLGYLEANRYQVLSNWTEEAALVDPATVDWVAVAQGSTEIRVRQLPGAENSMGGIKFMMPNDFGIYLHDTPNKVPFASEDRWISNGCVRVEDAPRLARWLFGDMPRGSDPDVEEKVELAEPVPVYLTYLTTGTSSSGEVVFRKDPYDRDARLLARYFGPADRMASLGD